MQGYGSRNFSSMRALAAAHHLARAHLCIQCAKLLRNPNANEPHLGLSVARPKHHEAGLEFRHFHCSECEQEWTQRLDLAAGASRWTMKASLGAPAAGRQEEALFIGRR
ncbi:hypothetical protein FAZ21_09875 [Chitiniphilus eburneus]|uniref:Uncharacterized protein n=2 Tax=Chitiniphilus eburneus TaxID=2571148 RepID=A0A4U0PY09_9NEIS|nr:hypothetical protein FAZ21_09875 [Chitiniphilus eburneus]